MDIAKYIDTKRGRGVYLDKAFDKYASPPKQDPVIVDGVSEVVSRVSMPQSDFDKIALPVLTSWLKGTGGLAEVSRKNEWNTNKVGGVTALEYMRRAKKFDNPSLPLSERLTQMIYGSETSGDPQAWKTVNKFGYMGRAQMGKAFMRDYGIDRNRYMSDPVYQHESTVRAVERRVQELKGKYY